MVFEEFTEKKLSLYSIFIKVGQFETSISLQHSYANSITVWAHT